MHLKWGRVWIVMGLFSRRIYRLMHKNKTWFFQGWLRVSSYLLRLWQKTRPRQRCIEENPKAWACTPYATWTARHRIAIAKATTFQARQPGFLWLMGTFKGPNKSRYKIKISRETTVSLVKNEDFLRGRSPCFLLRLFKSCFYHRDPSTIAECMYI